MSHKSWWENRFSFFRNICCTHSIKPKYFFTKILNDKIENHSNCYIMESYHWRVREVSAVFSEPIQPSKIDTNIWGITYRRNKFQTEHTVSFKRTTLYESPRARDVSNFM